MGEVADEGIDLAQGERRGGLPLEVAPDEAVGGDVELEGRGAGVVDRGRAVLLREGEDAEDAPDAGLAVVAVDRRAQRADVGAGARGAREQRQRGGRGARRPIQPGGGA